MYSYVCILIYQKVKTTFHPNYQYHLNYTHKRKTELNLPLLPVSVFNLFPIMQLKVVLAPQ